MSLVDRKANKNGIPYLNKANIEQIAADYLASYNRSLLAHPELLDIDDFAENFLGITLDFAELSNNGSILGMIAFSDCMISAFDHEQNGIRYLAVSAGTAVIDSNVMIEHEYRGRYTIAHECAHWIIHRPVRLIYPNQLEICLDQATIDESKAIICRRNKTANDTNSTRRISDWREWQADYLAGCLLMPDMAVRNLAKSIKSKYQDIAQLSVRLSDGSEHNLLNASLIKKASETFHVSCQAAEVRLKQLDLIHELNQNQLTFTALAT